MAQLIFFHDHALIIILLIIATVFYATIRIIQNKQTRRFILERQIIETVWTIAPALILVFIAMPSVRLLYLIEEILNPVITLMILKIFHDEYKGHFPLYLLSRSEYTSNFITNNTENRCTVLYFYLYIFRNQRNKGNYCILNVGVYFLILFCSKACHYSLVFVNVISQLFELCTCNILRNSNVPRRFNVSC